MVPIGHRTSWGAGGNLSPTPPLSLVSMFEAKRGGRQILERGKLGKKMQLFSLATDNQLFPPENWWRTDFELLLPVKCCFVLGGGSLFSCWTVNEIEMDNLTIKCSHDQYNVVIWRLGSWNDGHSPQCYLKFSFRAAFHEKHYNLPVFESLCCGASQLVEHHRQYKGLGGGGRRRGGFFEATI